MNAKMWEELKTQIIEGINENSPTTHQGLVEARIMMEEVERRHLPERVAEILRDTSKDFNTQPIGTSFDTIAEALETGDLREIEKWVKK